MARRPKGCAGFFFRSTVETVNILPESRTRIPKRVVSLMHPLIRRRINYVQIFCANCGVPGPLVPSDNITFSFWLCDVKNGDPSAGCSAKWGQLAGTFTEPDAVFFQKLKDAQLEKFGRELTPAELLDELRSESSIISMLAKEKPKFVASS